MINVEHVINKTVWHNVHSKMSDKLSAVDTPYLNFRFYHHVQNIVNFSEFT